VEAILYYFVVAYHRFMFCFDNKLKMWLDIKDPSARIHGLSQEVWVEIPSLSCSTSHRLAWDLLLPSLASREQKEIEGVN
jgi:hypothetical protein